MEHRANLSTEISNRVRSIAKPDQPYRERSSMETTNLKKPSCLSCIYRHTFDNERTKPFMQCRRFPKILGEVSDGNNGNAFYNFIYPTVTPKDVCGEWRDRTGEVYEDYYEDPAEPDPVAA